jgi:DNA-binding GntR family transcriptional regulator
MTKNIQLPKQGLADRVYDELRQMVMLERIAPGERLVIDRLALRLGVSHTPLREAVARLEAEGLVKKVGSTYVTAAALDPVGFLQLWEARLILEPAAAELAALRAGDDILAGVVAALERSGIQAQESMEDDPQEFVRTDAGFHALIVNGADNPFLAEQLLRLHAHEHLLRLYGPAGAPARAATQAEHQAIADALRERDGLAAAEAMRTHLEHARARLFLLFDPAYRYLAN